MRIVSQQDGQFEVELLELNVGYSIRYGSHYTEYGTLPEALKEFESCVYHQQGCAGVWEGD